ncbi:hypothetical protein [Barnesiella sp. An22]|uniref:hypothetical protein n=1 Tax=Barnesiella sp. An22 TaxID=1965590 RepID=UPI003208FF87
MKEWNDDQWRELFDRHTPQPRRDRWFTRRVMNRLPRKRWSLETKISLVVLVLILLICTALCVAFARELTANPCWNCAGTWVMYGALTAACILFAAQLNSFFRSIYDAS